MQNKFYGWNAVFSFTLKKTCNKLYKIITVLIALIIAGVIIAVCVWNGKKTAEKEDKRFSIQKVMVVNETDLPTCNYKELLPLVSDMDYKKTEFEQNDDKNIDKQIKKFLVKQKNALAVKIVQDNQGYQLTCLQPENSKISEDECYTLVEDMKQCIKANMIAQMGLSETQVTTLVSQISIDYITAGKSQNLVANIIQMSLPLLFSFLMYFVILFYGQNISQSVSIEKTSKLIETLLTSIHPFAIFIGKILAVFSAAILQIAIWCAAVFVGLFGGNAIAQEMYPQYENSVVRMFTFVKEQLGESAVSTSAIVIACLTLFIGILFYCIIASLAGAIASKPEQVSSAQSIFVLPVVVSWGVTYYAMLAEKGAILSICRWIPFSIPFCVPGDVIVGNIGIFQASIALLLLIMLCALTMMFGAKIYKGMVLFQGEKIRLQTIIRMMKEK